MTRGWWHDKTPESPGARPPLPPSGRPDTIVQQTELQAFQIRFFEMRSDAKEKLTERGYATWLDIVRRRVMWELDRGASE